MEAEPVYEEEQDQGYFAEQGKPPQHPVELLLFVQSMYCFRNKIMHVLSFMWHFVTPKLFSKNYCLAKYISTSI